MHWDASKYAANNKQLFTVNGDLVDLTAFARKQYGPLGESLADLGEAAYEGTPEQMSGQAALQINLWQAVVIALHVLSLSGLPVLLAALQSNLHPCWVVLQLLWHACPHCWACCSWPSCC